MTPPRSWHVSLLPFLLIATSMVARAGETNDPPGFTDTPIDKSQYHLFNPTPSSLLRDINGLYDNPWTVDAGHFQLENLAFQYVRDENNGVRTTAYRVGPSTLKVGLLNNLDAHVEFNPYASVRYEHIASGASTRLSGFGDITSRFKWNIWGNDGGRTAFALQPSVKLPTSQDNLGNRYVEGAISAPFAVLLPQGWCLVVTPELSLLHSFFGNGYYPGLAQTTYLCHSIYGNLSGYADFYSFYSTERGVPWYGIMDFGLTYIPSKRVQIDLGMSVGVSRAPDDINPYLGLSFRF